MSTYPGTLDDLGATNPSSSDAMNSGAGHAAQHSEANDAIDAIQTTLGVDPQGSYTDVAERLDVLPDPVGATDGYVVTVDTDAYVLAAPTGGGGGGLVLVDSGTFSAASSVSLPNGTFDTTYDRYLLVFVATPSADCDIRLRERASGTDDSGSEYNWRNSVYGNDGGAAAQPTPAYLGTSIGIGWNVDGSRKSTWDITVDGPALSEDTTFHWNGMAAYNYTTNAIIHNVGAGEHVDANPFDALTVYPTTGNITGRWAVYGFAK